MTAAPFLPGDRVRHPRAGIGTVVEPNWPGEQTGITCVQFDSPVYEFPMTLLNTELRLAGTRVIPFEAMGVYEQTDHLELCHGQQPGVKYLNRAERAHNHRTLTATHPHTHRKEPT